MSELSNQKASDGMDDCCGTLSDFSCSFGLMYVLDRFCGHRLEMELVASSRLGLALDPCLPGSVVYKGRWGAISCFTKPFEYFNYLKNAAEKTDSVVSDEINFIAAYMDLLDAGPTGTMKS